MIKILSLLIVFLLTGCNLTAVIDTERHLDLVKIAANPSNYDKEKLTVVGYLLIDELGNLYLHSDTKDNSQFLDVVFFNSRNDNVTLNMELKCVFVSGVFREYTDEYIVLGWAISNIGIIKANKVVLCSETEQEKLNNE